MITIECNDCVSAAKQHPTLSVFRYRKYLAYLAVVVSVKRSKNRVTKFSINSKDDACAANKG